MNTALRRPRTLCSRRNTPDPPTVQLVRGDCQDGKRRVWLESGCVGKGRWWPVIAAPLLFRRHPDIELRRKQTVRSAQIARGPGCEVIGIFILRMAVVAAHPEELEFVWPHDLHRFLP